MRPSTHNAVLVLLAASLALVALPSSDASAQSRMGLPDVRLGVGASTVYSSVDGVGIGGNVRASLPINTDLSIAGDLGMHSYVFDGSNEAVSVFQPSISVILTLPRSTNVLYLVNGIGGHTPFGDNSEDSINGPVLFSGLGSVQRLVESTFYYEIVPTMLIGPDNVEFLLPLRLGLIF